MMVVAAALVVPRGVHAQAVVGGGITVFENCGIGDYAIFLALESDPAVAGRRLLRGAVQINCEDIRLFADEVAIEDTLIIATGHVVFSQRDLFVSAERAELDRKTRRGVFYNAGGVAQLTDRPIQPNMFGTQEPQVSFYGERIEKTGDRSYRITNGGFSTCAQPTPRWEIVGSSASVTLDERVILRNAVLKVKNVPIGYLPYLYYPLGEDDRSTGFLIPSYSSSSIQGTGISNAFFLVLGRSQDAIFKHTWFSKGGQVMSGRYRFVSAPGSNGDVEFTMLNTPPDTTGGVSTGEGARSFTIRGGISQALPNGFRLTGNANYFTDLLAEQLYQQNLYRATERQRSFSASISGTVRRVRLTATMEQRDRFFGLQDAAREGTLPRVSLSLGDRPIGRSRVYFGIGGETAYLVNQNSILDPASNRSLLRFDAAPTLRAPLSTLPWLSVSTAASWRFTHWLESLDPETQAQVPERLTRHLLDLKARAVGPKFSRVWSPDNSYAIRVKHLIEPELGIQWLSPFDRIDQVVKHDGVDYQVGRTTTITYGLSNTIMVRRRGPTGAAGDVREIVKVTLSQSYYSNQLAASYDPTTQLQSTGSFTSLRLNVAATPADNVSANFMTEIDPDFRRPRSYTLSGTVNRARAQFTGGWSRRPFIPGLRGNEESSATHFLNTSVGVRPFDGRVQGRYEINLDIRNRALLQQCILFSYSAQCCGVNVDYQTFSFAHLPGVSSPTDRRFGISFTLAGIGSFSNPFGSFGNNSGR